MEKVLYFDSLVVNFLCFIQPIVTKTIPIILIKGCSNEVKRNALSDICPNDAKPNGDTKYKIKPIKNCVWIAANPNIEIFRSFGVNSFLENNPTSELTIAITTNNKAIKAQLE